MSITSIFLVIVFGLVFTVLLNWFVWLLIPPLSTHKLASKTHGKFVDVRGIDTYYEVEGNGSALILITPGGGHASMWRQNVQQLSKKYTVYCLDLPGSGLSAKPTPTEFAYTHAAFAEFVDAFMSKLKIRQAIVGGQSFGGTVALQFALDFTEKTMGLILIASGGYPQRTLALNRFEFINSLVMSFSSYHWVVGLFIDQLYYDARRFVSDETAIRELCDIYRTKNSRKVWFWMSRALNWSFALPDPRRIADVSVPTLVIWGAQDRIVDVSKASCFAQDIEHSTVTVFEQAGHMVHQERPVAVNEAILRFLATLNK